MLMLWLFSSGNAERYDCDFDGAWWSLDGITTRRRAIRHRAIPYRIGIAAKRAIR
jgi:hypothetical protein